MNYILVSGIYSVIKDSCDYIIFIDDISGEDSIGERYLLHSLLQGCNQLKNSRICVVTNERLSFIPRMYSIVSKIILITDITDVEPVWAIGSVCISSEGNLFLKALINTCTVLRSMVFRLFYIGCPIFRQTTTFMVCLLGLLYI